MSLGNVYHCTLITVLGLYCLDLFYSIGTARGDYFIHIIIIIIVFGHTVQGVLDSDLIYIRYYTLILFWVYFACWHNIIIASHMCIFLIVFIL